MKILDDIISHNNMLQPMITDIIKECVDEELYVNIHERLLKKVANEGAYVMANLEVRTLKNEIATN